MPKFAIDQASLSYWLDELDAYWEKWRDAVSTVESAIRDEVAVLRGPSHDLEAVFAKAVLMASKQLALDIAAVLAGKQPGAALRELVESTANKSWHVASHPIVVRIMRDVLRDLSLDKEPTTRLAIVGLPGTGKTTMGFWIVALLYGFTKSLCSPRGSRPLGEIGVRHRCFRATFGNTVVELPCITLATPPDFDCGIDMEGEGAPSEWRFLLDVVVATVNLHSAVRTISSHVIEKYENSESVELWAYLLDEAGAGAFGSAMFFLRQKTYAEGSIFVQLSRTIVPFSVLTTTGLRRLGAAAREVVTDVLYIDPCRYGQCPGVRGEEEHLMAVTRLDGKVPHYGFAENPRSSRMQGRLYLATYPALRLPTWFYKEHLKYRRRILEEVRKIVTEIKQKSAEHAEDLATYIAATVLDAMREGKLEQLGVAFDGRDYKITTKTLKRLLNMNKGLTRLLREFNQKFAELGIDCKAEYSNKPYRHVRISHDCLERLLA